MKMSKLAGPGRAYIGPLPEEEISGRLAFRKVPSEEWRAEHPVGIECDPPEDKDMVIECVVLGSFAYPSRLKHPSQWDRGQFPLTLLATTPYLEWKAAGDADILRQKMAGVPSVEPEPAASEPEVAS